MASPRKIYKRTGLRRDKNFADLSDSKQALNNLLDTLVDTADGTFISEDLEPIRTIFTTGLNAGEYQGFIGSSVKETSPDGSINAVSPAITYQNRLDNFRVTSGEPRLNGGNGLTAKYFNQDQVEDTDDVFTGTTSNVSIPSDTFWEAGQFDYTGKIHPQSVNAAGGVQWEGFFVPTQTGAYGFSVSSTLGFTIDFETEGYTSGVGTYTEYARIGLSTAISGVSTTSGTNTVTIPVANVVNVGVGMIVTAASNNRIKLGSKIISVTRSTGAITLENADGNSINTSGTTSVSFGRTLGENSSISYSTYILERARKYRVRYRVFVPAGTTNLTGVPRSISFGFNRPGSTGATLRYNNLYSLDYDFSEGVKGNINKFLDESILLGGNKENGGERIGGLTQPEYVKVLTDKKVDIKYIPKESLSQIERKTSTVSWSAGTKILSIGDTTNVEVGNYVFAATTGLTGNINTPVRVIQVVINSFVVIDTSTTGSGSSVALTFIDHRGFVKRVTASGSSGTVTISSGDTVGLKSKQIAIWNGSEKYTGITTSGSSNQLSVSPAIGFGSRRVYFYESRGLIDTALAAFCPTTGPSETRCVFVTGAAAAGSTTLTVSNATNDLINKTIQGVPFADNTTISAVNGNQITISLGTIKNIVAGSNFTATDANEDKSLCCPPTDTSPPFNPTEEGLETILSGADNIKIAGGNLIFDNLTATVNTNNITVLTGTNNSSKRIELKGGDGVVYNLLCE